MAKIETKLSELELLRSENGKWNVVVVAVPAAGAGALKPFCEGRGRNRKPLPDKRTMDEKQSRTDREWMTHQSRVGQCAR